MRGQAFFVFRGPGLPFPCREKAEGCSCNGAQQRDCPCTEVRSTISPLLAPRFFLSRPLRQVVAPYDNLLLMDLPEDLLTLTSGHRRGGSQLDTIELRPPIRTSPSLQSPHLSAPTCKKCATAFRDRTSSPLRIFLCHDTDLTLEGFAAQVGSYQGNRARGMEIFAASGAKTESQTLLSSENVKISHRAGQRTSKKDMSPEHCLLGHGHVDALFI